MPAELRDVDEPRRGILDQVQRIGEVDQADDAALDVGDVSVGVARDDGDVVAAAVIADQQFPVERAAEGAALVLDDAVGRVVQPIGEGASERGRGGAGVEPAEVAVGHGADRIGRDFVGVDAGGGVPAVEDEFPARRVGLAVVPALDDVHHEVGLRLLDGNQPRDVRAGVDPVGGEVDALVGAE